MLLQIAFLLWLNFNVLTASRDAEDTSQVLQATYFRSYWLGLCNQETRYWLGIRAQWLMWEIGIEVELINTTYSSLSRYNQDLRIAISELRPDIQTSFYQKNVNIYERDANNNRVAISLDDSFEAVDKIVLHGFKDVNKPAILPPEPTTLNFIDPDTRFIFDNSFNDLLLVSENLMEKIKAYQFSNLDSARTHMLVFLVITLSLLLLFILWSFRYVYNLNREFQRFLRVFFLLPNTEAKKTETIISKLHDILKDDSEEQGRALLVNPSRLFFDLKKASNPFPQAYTKIGRKVASQSSLRKHNMQGWKLLLQLYTALSIMIVIMVLYYNKALSQIQAIQKQQVNINSALGNLNTQSLISAQIQDLALENGTTTVRNRPIKTNLISDLDSLKSVTEIQKNLRDQGELSPRQQEIFFNLNCAKAYSESYLLPYDMSTVNCYFIAKGLDSLGLVNVLPDMTSTLNQFIENFEASNRTFEALKEVYDPSGYQPLIDLSMVYFLLSFNATVEEYNSLMNNLEEERIALAWTAVIVSLSLFGLMWIFIVRRIVRRRFVSQDLLNLVPRKLIMKSLPLKKYVDSLQKG